MLLSRVLTVICTLLPMGSDASRSRTGGEFFREPNIGRLAVDRQQNVLRFSAGVSVGADLVHAVDQHALD